MDLLSIVFISLLLSFIGIVFWGAPYVPTLRKDIADMIELRPLTNKDTFVDLGCGDGVILRAVAPLVKKAVGYELSPWMYMVSKVLCRTYANIAIRYANIWRTTLPRDTTVIYIFFSSRHMDRIAKKVQSHVDEVGHGVDVVSLGFAFKGRKSIAQKNALHLYHFAPLYKHK